MQNKLAYGNTFRAQIEASTPRKMLLRGAIVSWLGAVCLVRASSSAAPDYCDPSLCPGRAHVACGVKPDKFSKMCELDADAINFSAEESEQILMRLNEVRNKVAHGNFKGLMAAANMPTLVWDRDLAFIAGFNVRHCKLYRDPCRNTAKYRNVGQSVSYLGQRGTMDILKDIITRQTTLWLSEEKLATMDDIASYKGPQHKPIHNFAQMLYDGSHKVGCAALQQSKNGWMQTYFTCNFDEAPVIGRPIFNTSTQPGEGCVSGKNPTFESLCAAPNMTLDSNAPPTKNNGNETDKQSNDVKTFRGLANLDAKITSDEIVKEFEDSEREKEWWRSKFYRFLKKIGRAKKEAHKWNVVVLTMNHEVEVDRPVIANR